MTNPYINLMRTAWKYSSKNKTKFILMHIMFIGANICISLKPLLYGRFINSLQNSHNNNILSSAWDYVWMILGIYFLSWFFQGPGRVIERTMAFTISKLLLEELFMRVLDLPVHWHQEHHSGATVNRILKAQKSLRDFFQNGSVYLQTIIQFLISFFAILYFSTFFAFIAMLLGILIAMLISAFDKPYIKNLKAVYEGDNIVSSRISDSLKNILTVKILGLAFKMHSRVMQQTTKNFDFYKSTTITGEWKWFSSGSVVQLTYCLIIVGYVYKNNIPGKPFNIGQLVILIGFIEQFSNLFLGIATKYNQIIQYETDVQAVSILFEMPLDTKNHSNAPTIKNDWTKIVLRNFTFKYHEVENSSAKNKLIQPNRFQGLTNLDFTIIHGSRIALVGGSGSGKSTFFSVLQGLYTPQSGSLLFVDELTSFKWADLAGIITLFPQQPEIFEGTIMYNLTFGHPYQIDDILSACEVACFKSVLDQFPDGLNSEIHENGSNLSGGQKQRLALARGILASKHSSIILLDESTSNIDQQTEEEVYRNIFKHFEDKTIICSIHHLRLLNLFEEIYLFNEGKILKHDITNAIQ